MAETEEKHEENPAEEAKADHDDSVAVDAAAASNNENTTANSSVNPQQDDAQSTKPSEETNAAPEPAQPEQAEQAEDTSTEPAVDIAAVTTSADPPAEANVDPPQQIESEAQSTNPNPDASTEAAAEVIDNAPNNDEEEAKEETVKAKEESEVNDATQQEVEVEAKEETVKAEEQAPMQEKESNATPQKQVERKVGFQVEFEATTVIQPEENFDDKESTKDTHITSEKEETEEKEEEEEEDEPEVDQAELERIARCEKLSRLVTEAKDEASDLRSHSYHLLKQIIAITEKNNNTLGLDEEAPSTMNLLSNSSNMESKQNELYENLLKEVEYLHLEYSNKQTKYNERISTLNDRVIENDENAMKLKNTYKNFKRKMCKNVNKKSSNSSKIETKWILQTEEEEEAIEDEIEQERLKNIHYSMSLKKLSQKLKEKDKLSDGLHLIDFEQLKIENQTLNEKIEERNDELYKLKKKITNTVQILAHIKEKLQFVNKINEELMEKQKRLDNQVSSKRDRLNELKKTRDAVRIENNKLKRKQGFIANDVLVIDFQQTKTSYKANQQKLKQYKQKYQTLQKTIKLADSLQHDALS